MVDVVYTLDAQYSTVPLDEKTTAGVRTGELTTKEPFKHFLVISESTVVLSM